MSEKAQRAKALFLEGYNCAQAVAGAFAPEMGLFGRRRAARLASGFGEAWDGCGMRCGKRYDAGRKARCAAGQRPQSRQRKPIPTR